MENYQELFDHMSKEHNVTLLEQDMSEIIHIVNRMQTPPRDTRGLLVGVDVDDTMGKQLTEEQLWQDFEYTTEYHDCYNEEDAYREFFIQGIKAARKQPADNWIDVSDRLPEVTETDQWDKERQVSDRVIVIECGVEKFAKYNYIIGAWLVEGRSGNIQVTHWFKLPNQPSPTPKQ